MGGSINAAIEDSLKPLASVRGGAHRGHGRRPPEDARISAHRSPPPLEAPQPQPDISMLNIQEMRGLVGLLGGCRRGQTEPASATTSPSRCLDVGHLAASQGINTFPGAFQAQFQGSLRDFRPI